VVGPEHFGRDSQRALGEQPAVEHLALSGRARNLSFPVIGLEP
jgi:hypothetical protein